LLDRVGVEGRRELDCFQVVAYLIGRCRPEQDTGDQWIEERERDGQRSALRAKSLGERSKLLTDPKSRRVALVLGAYISLGLSVAFGLLPPATLLAIVFGFISLRTARALGGLRHTEALWGVLLGFAPIPITTLWLAFGTVLGAITDHPLGR